MARSSNNRVGTTEKSLALLEALERRDGAGVTELSDVLDMSKSTVHSHLSTLVDCGYVRKHDQQYHVGTKFLRLGGRLRDQSPLYRAARPEMSSLADASGGVVRLYLAEEERVTLLEEEGYCSDAAERHLGQQFPLTESVAGLAVLADRTEDDPPESTDDDLAERLDGVRRRGYAVEGRDPEPVRTLAAAVDGRSETAEGTLTVTSSGDDDAEEAFSLAERLVTAVERTALNLTFWNDSTVTFSPKHSWHVDPE